MKEILYEWIRNMVFYQLLISIIINLIPSNAYLKYIRFFLGMLFIVIAIQPVFRVFKLTETIDSAYIQKMLEQELEENSFSLSLKEPEQEYEESQ